MQIDSELDGHLKSALLNSSESDIPARNEYKIVKSSHLCSDSCTKTACHSTESETELMSNLIKRLERLEAQNAEDKVSFQTQIDHLASELAGTKTQLASVILRTQDFQALVKGLEENAVHFEAVQSEYYGAEDEDNHKSALKYKEKNHEFDSVLSLIEIALNGYVSGDSNGDSVCWTPSQVHQDLFSRDHYARLWHRRVKKDHSSYGKAGHFMVFGPMNVSLKDVGQFTEEQLKALDPKNDFLYIHNYQPECSDYVGPVTDARYADSDSKRKEEINRNWGLPVVASFVEESPAVIAASKPKFARPIPKSLKLSEENWPSLGTVSTKSKGGQVKK